MTASPEERGAVFEMFGVPADRAVALASWADPVMAESILALYRSAVDVGSEWGPDFMDIPKPGLVVVPTEDPFLSGDSAAPSAHRAGAPVVKLEGIGHWWMLQDPGRGAQVLEDFWASLD
jgi:pimeloyl-ACP methyl ester carboxylesterase